jgi:hypothetical protein
MSVRVTFDVFSGRPNPTVVFESEDSASLLDRLKPAMTSAGKPAEPPPQSFLGYRGILVEDLSAAKAGRPTHPFRVVDGKVFADGMERAAAASVEDFVFERAEAMNIGADVFAAIRVATAARKSSTFQSGAAPDSTSPSPIPACSCAPQYEPQWWNDAASGGSRQIFNNCYNYATNYRTDTFAQPGLGTGQIFPSPITSVGMSAAAVRDALEQTQQSTCPKEGNLVALFIAPSIDFHWYRLGRNGLWTHKPGPTPATNVDNSGAIIHDPRQANRGIYTQFCGFMLVKHGHIKIR